MKALSVPLGLFPGIAPDIHTMPSDKDRTSLRVIANGITQRICELVFPCSVLDDRDSQLVEVAIPFDAFDHLLMGDTKLSFAFKHGRDEVAAVSVAV